MAVSGSGPDRSDGPAVSRRLAEACLAFEDAWRDGQRPRIEEVLERCHPFDRPVLLLHLIGIEVRQRQRLGETPLPDEYMARFPADGETVVGFDWSLPASPAMTSAGPRRRQVGRFELIERIGAGGFGEVWRAVDPHLQREVALKLGRYDVSDDGRPDLLLHEARSAGQLRHPAIVPVHETGVEGDVAYIVSDYIPGTTLDRRLKAGPLPAVKAVELALALAGAVAHAHARGVIHRDIKPSNVLLDPAGGPHLTDFGVARRVAGDKTISEAGQALGTPAYMSPEQARGDGVDPRGDVYALGLVLYEMLAGRRAYPGTASEALRDVLLGPPTPLRSIRPDLPRALLKIVEVATAREPNDRYQTVDSFAGDLGRFLRGEPAYGPCVGPIGRIKRLLRHRPAIAIAAAAVALPVAIPVGVRLGLFRAGAETAQVAQPSGAELGEATRTGVNSTEPRPGEAKPVPPVAVAGKQDDDGEQLVEIRTEPRAARLWLFPHDALGYPMPERRIDVPDPAKPFVTLDRGVEYLIVADCGEGRFAEVDRRVPTRGEIEAAVHETIDCFFWYQGTGSSIRFELKIPPPPSLDRFVFVPGGRFAAGGLGRDVIVPPYYLAAEELTVGEYLAIEAEWRERNGLAGPARLPGDVPPDLASDASMPLSVADAIALFAKAGYRLPNEFEWEYAAMRAAPRARAPDGLPILGMRSGFAELTGSRMNPYPWEVDPAIRPQLEALAHDESLFDARGLRSQSYVVRGGGPQVWGVGNAAGQEPDIHARYCTSIIARHLGVGVRPARSLNPRREVDEFVRLVPSDGGTTLAARHERRR